MAVTKEILLRAISEYKITYSSFYFKELKNLKPKQIANARKHIIPNVNEKDIIAILDETALQSGKSGFAFTKDALYFSDKYRCKEEKKTRYMKFSDITDVKQDDKNLYTEIHYKNGEVKTFLFYSFSEDIQDFLRLVIQYSKEAEVPKESETPASTVSTVEPLDDFDDEFDLDPPLDDLDDFEFPWDDSNDDFDTFVASYEEKQKIEKKAEPKVSASSYPVSDEVRSILENAVKEIREKQAKEEALAGAQQAFEKALILWMSGDATYEGRDLRSWANEALQLGHPRAQHLLWLMDGLHHWHFYESGYLFDALNFRKNGNIESCYKSFSYVEEKFDVDGMLCLAWCLYLDKEETKDIIKAQRILGQTKQYRNDSPLWRKVSQLSHTYYKKHKMAMVIHEKVLQSLEAAQKFVEEDDYDEAIEKYEFAYKYEPIPELGYEFALALQYRDMPRARVIMQYAMKEGHGASAKSLMTYYGQGPNGTKNNFEYVKCLDMLRRIDPEAASSPMSTWEYNGIGGWEWAHRYLPRCVTPKGEGLRVPDAPIPEDFKNKICAGWRVHFGTNDWIVVERQGDRLLLLSELVIDIRHFNKKNPNVTWETSDIRHWLNTKYLSRTFTKKQQALIEETILNNPRVDGKPDDPQTKDKIFLFSVEEARKYFGVHEYHQAPHARSYVNALGRTSALSYIEDKRYYYDPYNRAYNYFLRTSGIYPNSVCSIGGSQIYLSPDEKHHISTTRDNGIRPALWMRMR